jgi:hypothetical protein
MLNTNRLKHFVIRNRLPLINVKPQRTNPQLRLVGVLRSSMKTAGSVKAEVTLIHCRHAPSATEAYSPPSIRSSPRKNWMPTSSGTPLKTALSFPQTPYCSKHGFSAIQAADLGRMDVPLNGLEGIRYALKTVRHLLT